MKSVSHCQYTGTGVLAHVVDEKDVKIRVSLLDVRAGVVFPTGSLPGYYVLFGRKAEQLPSGKLPIMYLTEGEHIMHDALFEMLTDACTEFKCRTIYAMMPPRDKRMASMGGFDDLWKYIRAKHLPIKVVPAPAAKDPDYGKAVAREYWADNALEVPPSDLNPTTLVKQSKDMAGIIESGKADTGAQEDKLYAFHAMRHVLCGFVKFNNVVQYDQKPVKSARSDARGWT